MQKPGSEVETGFSNFQGPLEIELARLGKRKRLAFDRLDHLAAADALGASDGFRRSAFWLFDVNRLQVHEKVAFGDTSRLPTVTPQVLGLTSFDLGIATSWLAVAVDTFLHLGCTFLKHTKRLRWKGGSILAPKSFASPAN